MDPCQRKLHRPRLVSFGLVLVSVWMVALASAPAPVAANGALAAARPRASPHGWVRSTPVPILVYHHVQRHLAGYYLMYVGTSQFASQLRYLRTHGYHPVTMQQVWDDWTGKERLPRHPVVLTFDDGYPDQYFFAARQLRTYHWPAVLDLVVDRGTGLSDSQVRRMVRWDWEIGSHTLHHVILTHSSSAALRRELVDSRRALEHKFGVPVDFFCYPGGIYDRRVMRAARAAGYLAATSIHYGAATPALRFALPRIAVYWGESLATFGRRIREAVARAR